MLGVTMNAKQVHDLNNDVGAILAECDLLDTLVSKYPAAAARVQSIRKAARNIADKISSSSWPGSRGSQPPEKTDRSHH